MPTAEVMANLVTWDREAAPVLDALNDAGVLEARSPENGASVAESLLQTLGAPRHPEFDPLHIYWCLLERLYNPYTNTQLINVPFSTGELGASTCVSAVRI